MTLALAALGIIGALLPGLAHAARPDEIVILHDGTAFPRPPCASCVQHEASLPLPSRRFKAVIVSGHSGFGAYVGLSTYELARTIAELSPEPEFVVLDTCYGAQAELLLALEDVGVRSRVVLASADAVDAVGFDYGDTFATPEITADTVAAEVSVHGRPLSRFVADDIPRLRAIVAEQHQRFARCEGFDELISYSPNLVRVADTTRFGETLVHIPRVVVAPCFGPAPDEDRDDLAWLGMSVLSLFGAATIALRRKDG